MLATQPSTVITLACSIEGWKFQRRTPTLEERAVLALAGQLHEALVGVGPGEEDVDLHPAVGGGQQPLGEVVVRHEVGGGDPDALVRQLEERLEQGGHVAQAGLRCPSDALDDRPAGLGLIGEAVDALVEHAAVGLGPVVEEGGPQAVDGRTLDAEVGVAPLGLVAGVAQPAVGDPHPSREPDGFVGDEDLAVGAVVELARPQPVQRSEPVDLRAGVLDPSQHPLVHRVGAPGVQQDPDPHAVGGPRRQAPAQLVAHLAGPVHEGEEVDRVLGGIDGLEHRREDLVPVAQDVDLIALGGRHAQHTFQRPADAGPVVGPGVGARHPLSVHAPSAPAGS